MVVYGQVVVGPPGSGKTTYCNGMQQYLRLIGRETLVINLDPANEAPAMISPGTSEANESKESHLPYDTILDVSEEVVNLSSVMTKLKLGPNGGLVYCMEYMEHHLDSIASLLSQRIQDATTPQPPYLIFDLPGQVELYTHNTCVQNILSGLVSKLSLNLCAVHLVDAHACTDATKFISSALLSTTTMIRLELPAVNVLSKIDLLAGGGYGSGNDHDNALPFNLDFFTECHDLHRLLSYLDGGLDSLHSNDHDDIHSQSFYADDPEYQKARQRTRNTKFYQKHAKLHEALCEVVEDFGLLRYVPLNISDAESVGRVVSRIDKCNGYVFVAESRDSAPHRNAGKGTTTGTASKDARDMFQCAMQMDGEWGYEQLADVQERFLGLFQERIPELDRRPERRRQPQQSNQQDGDK